LKPEEALKLVRRYVEQRPLSENIVAASLILGKALMEPESSELGKENAAPEEDGRATA
jgi:hypothetical protein